MSDFAQSASSFFATTSAPDETFYEAIFRESIDGILIATESGRCMDANVAATEILGRRREDLLGHRVINPCEQGEKFWHQGRSGGTTRLELGVEGRTVDVAGVIEVKPGRYMVVIRKLTAENSRDDQGAIRRLAGKVAHDLGNQLMVISGYTEMMLDEMAQADPMRKQAREVLKASSRAIELTHQLLALDHKKNKT